MATIVNKKTSTRLIPARRNNIKFVSYKELYCPKKKKKHQPNTYLNFDYFCVGDFSTITLKKLEIKRKKMHLPPFVPPGPGAARWRLKITSKDYVKH